MSTPIRFSWTLRRADHLDLLRTSMPLIRFAPLFAAALAVAGVVLLVLGQWLPGVLGLVLGALVLAVPYWQAVLSERHYPLAGKEISASADQTRVKLDVAAHAHSELAWDRISGWSDTGRTIVLRTGSAGGYPIPRRAFTDPGQAAEFTKLLHAKVGAPGNRPR
ncbi:YcxB family protein [Sciscionella sediminilitoris]|uniref:YcxB family protein n=1 Tax=Sciscionella sediminilitoris TaxID=1445613 RepID=UPI0004DF6871|nr:YcxB family protein [Sciscionella sp. SE31]